MNHLTYEMFGAVGDGVADDLQAVVRTHEEANARGLPVRARSGATYRLSNRALTACIRTDTDWRGATFIMEDVDCEDHTRPLFSVESALPAFDLPVESLAQGQTEICNPTGRMLHLTLINEGHRDYVRKGLNQNNGDPRMDVFLVDGRGRLDTPAALAFDRVTSAVARPVDDATLTLQGGCFITVANRAESRYNYHWRNIVVGRSRVEVAGLRHEVRGEGDHGAPYRGFLSVRSCAMVEVRDCVFTGHKTYWTIGSAALPVPMGSYDIDINAAVGVSLRRCSQTNDIMDSTYWGLIGTNFCHDLLLEDCAFSRFDAHCGVNGCTLRRCTLGHQCLNAIGFGTFVVEQTRACGRALVNLRGDYGSTWRGDMIIRDCQWQPLGAARAVFDADNDGTHDFGYPCHLPAHVLIDGLSVVENDQAAPDAPLCIFNDYVGAGAAPRRPFLPVPPVSVEVRRLDTRRPVQLCEKPALMPDTAFRMG